MIIQVWILLLERFKKLNTWGRKEQRVPHKPLFVFIAISHLQNKNQRLLSFKEVNPKLEYLLKQYGPSRKSYHLEYAFWWLQNDNIWEVKDRDKLETRASNTDAKKSELIKNNIHAGFTTEIFEILKKDKKLVHKVINQSLYTQLTFPKLFIKILFTRQG